MRRRDRGQDPPKRRKRLGKGASLNSQNGNGKANNPKPASEQAARGVLRCSGVLAVREYLKPRRHGPSLYATASDYWHDPSPSIAVIGQVDRATHPLGWRYDIVHWTWPEVAAALVIEGEA